MKRLINILIMMAIFRIALAENEEIASILKDGGFTLSEQKVIFSIFEDAKEKGVPSQDLIILIKEQRLKKSTYYEISTEMIKKVKILSSVKDSGFPYWTDNNIRKIAFYLAELYTTSQFMELVKEINKTQLKKNEIENLFKFILFLNSSEIPSNDIYSLTYLLVKNKEVDQAALNAIQKVILRSKDLKLNRQQIVIDISKQLIREIPLRKVIENIEKRAKEEN
ncbi:MAG: hypothetical protein N2258_02960 [Brevinematales bacterium]|nr:hypothetical protein [Brevinematales bacterium]